MIDFLDLFGDVLLYPINPAGLDLAENPLILFCLVILIGLAIFRIFRTALNSLI